MNEIRVLAVLLVVLLGVAAATVEREGGPRLGDFDLTSAGPSDFDVVVLESRSSTITLEQRPEYRWLTVERNGQTRSFVAAPTMADILERLLPLGGLRSLGVRTPEELQSFSLAPPKMTLEVQVGDKLEVVELGERPLPKSAEIYARLPGSSEVWLADWSVLEDFMNADRFRQRKLRWEDRQEVTRARITLGDFETVAIQRNRRKPRESFWASERAPEEKNDALDALMLGLERVVIESHPEPEPELSEPPLLSVEWLGEAGETLANASIWKVEGEQGPVFYAKSEDTVRVVQLPVIPATKVEAAADAVRNAD